MSKTYLVFHLVGYNSPKNGEEMTDKVVIRLIDKTYAMALLRAQEIIERDFWFLGEVIEFNEKS